MALIGNYYLFNKLPLRFRGGSTLADSRSNYSMSGSNRNQFQSYARFNSTPNGYSHPAAWIQPQTDGGLASYRQLSGVISNTANLAGGINVTANLTGSINLTSADLALVVGLISAISGSGLLTNAALAGVSSIAASISATGTITSADLGAIVGFSAALSAQGLLTDVNIISLYELSADITPFTELSPQTLSAQILDAEDIETSISLREALRLILASAAGKLSGAPGTTITIRNVGDTKNRIVATVDSNGNRSSLTYDVAD